MSNKPLNTNDDVISVNGTEWTRRGSMGNKDYVVTDVPTNISAFENDAGYIAANEAANEAEIAINNATNLTGLKTALLNFISIFKK